jgi:hypothetical protein
MCNLLYAHSLVLRYLHPQLGSKFGTWLLERQLTPKYSYLGTNKEGTCYAHLQLDSLDRSVALGCGGLQEQIPYQGLDPQCTCRVCFVPHVAFTLLVAIIVKIKGLSH